MQGPCGRILRGVGDSIRWGLGLGGNGVDGYGDLIGVLGMGVSMFSGIGVSMILGMGVRLVLGMNVNLVLDMGVNLVLVLGMGVNLVLDMVLSVNLGVNLGLVLSLGVYGKYLDWSVSPCDAESRPIYDRVR